MVTKKPAAKPAPSPRRAASTRRGGTVAKKVAPQRKPEPIEEVEELETSAVSVETVEDTPEEVETEEVEDLDEDEAEEYEDEYDEDDEEEDEEEGDDSISEDTKAAIAAEMEKDVEPEPVQIRRLTLLDIERAKDITEEPFFVEEWEGEILLRSPSARKLIAMIKDSGQGQLSIDSSGKASTSDVEFDVMLRELVMMSVVDPVIDEAAYEMILDKSGGALFGIFGKIREIAKLDRIGSNGKKIDAVKEEEKTFRKG